MSDSVTTSLRLDARLRRALERRSRREGRGKSWIINRALENYLMDEKSSTLEDEARRQSLLASKSLSGDWVEAGEFDQWR